MKRFIFFILLVFILPGCISSRKSLQSGNYDLAISKAVKKVQRKRTNEKEILVLEEAYRKANDRDKERINFLKLEGRPENWDNIFDLYTSMNRRQNIIKPLVPLEVPSNKRKVNFEFFNYDTEIINAKEKAAEYFYTHAITLMEKGDRDNARKAYYELKQVKHYYANFKDVDDQIIKAKNQGTSYILFKMQNKTGIPLPPNFEEDLTKISLSELNSEWLNYNVKENKNTHYDYTILVNMKLIDVAPESVKEIQYVESKEVQDGWDYFLDNKGNVKKDSLGNDIKKPKYKTISCTVNETYQSKKAIISGSLDYINNDNNQLIKTDPITAESFFEYRSATGIGDLNALKPETKSKLGKLPVPFPSGFNMLLQAGQNLKSMVKDIIWRNKNVLK